jgi:hypothetical protein
LNAAVVTTEGINEAKDNGKTVSITTLDAEKAFDKLVHNILFRKLYHYNIDDDADERSSNFGSNVVIPKNV